MTLERGSGARMPTPARLILRLSPQQERSARQLVSPAAAVFCSDDREAINALRIGGISGIVWELSHQMPRLPNPVPEQVVEAAGRVPVNLHVEVTPAHIREVISLAQTACDLRVSFVGSRNLERALLGLLASPPERTAEQAIIVRIALNVEEFARDVVAVAAVASKRRTTVGQLSQLCGCSIGKLAYRLRRIGVATSDLLGWTVSLHAVWSRGVLEWPMKRTAYEAGFSTRAGIAHYVRRHTCVRLGKVTDPHQFQDLLERFAAHLGAR
jgi:hypothetical protein